jgi:protein phosphatase
MEVEYFSVKGKREDNEDFVLSKKIDETKSVHLIADGMGGYEYGRLAAENAASYIVSFLQENIDDDKILELLEKAVKGANNLVGKLGDKYNARMGATIAGVFIFIDSAYFFWVGDVKIVCIRKGVMVFESEDHSLINEYTRRRILLEKFQADAIRHIVTRCIQGDSDTAKVDIRLLKLVKGDKIVICSDGVFENIEVQDLVNISDDFNVDKLKNKFEDYMDNCSMLLIGF